MYPSSSLAQDVRRLALCNEIKLTHSRGAPRQTNSSSRTLPTPYNLLRQSSLCDRNSHLQFDLESFRHPSSHLPTLLVDVRLWAQILDEFALNEQHTNDDSFPLSSSSSSSSTKLQAATVPGGVAEQGLNLVTGGSQRAVLGGRGGVGGAALELVMAWLIMWQTNEESLL
jgi:hypothetical protein